MKKEKKPRPFSPTIRFDGEIEGPRTTDDFADAILEMAEARGWLVCMGVSPIKAPRKKKAKKGRRETK